MIKELILIVVGALIFVFSRPLTHVFRGYGVRKINDRQKGIKISINPSANEMFGERNASLMIKLWGIFGIVMGVLGLIGIINF